MTAPRLAASLLALALVLGPAAARAQPCPGCVEAGAASVPLQVPAGTPLAGYGALARRLLLPDVLGRHPHAFWFQPSRGERDPLAARALVVERAGVRLAWVTIDLVAVDGGFAPAVAARLGAAGVPPATVLVSASHTHSGPGAFVGSAVMAFWATDRLDGEVREALVGAAVEAIRRADAARGPAVVATASVAAPVVTRSRFGQALDREIVLLRLSSAGGAPIALVWNFAIHGTMLGARNLTLSADVMGIASRALERDLGVPALFVNGAVGDVSPAGHGAAAAEDIGAALAAAVRAGWSAAEPSRRPALQIRRQVVALPAPHLSLRNCLGRWLPRAAALPLGDLVARETELVAVGLGDTAWVTFPGELQTVLGQEVKRAGRRHFRHAFVAGLSNDYLAYFVTARDYDRPAYVTCSTLYGPRAGACLATTAGALLARLRDGNGGVRDAPPARCDGAQ